jgi:RNA polymerase sigma-70 factor (ECF subfamily)
VTAETSIGAGQSQFPTTLWLDRPLSDEELAALAGRYWRPVYRFIRAVWRKPVEDAKDLTQEFFATVFDRDFLSKADPRRGNFRQFLLASVRNFLKNDARATSAEKRGGARVTVSLDAEDLAEPAAGQDPDDIFNRAWGSELLQRALALLESDYRARGKAVWFETFREHWFGDAQPTYRDIAARHGISEFDVRNYLVAGMRDLRRICRSLVLETVKDPAAVDEEMELLFWKLP